MNGLLQTAGRKMGRRSFARYFKKNRAEMIRGIRIGFFYSVVRAIHQRYFTCYTF